MFSTINLFMGIKVAACLLTLSLLSCTESPREPLRVASSPWPGYEPLYLGRDLGYIKPELVNLFELPSSDISMESFRNKSADAATLTLDETLELLHDGVRLRILQVLDISHGGDAVLARADIKSLAQLKGKRISIVNITLGLYMLNRVLDKAGLTRKDVTIFPMSEQKQEEFYKQGKADVVITFEPVKTKLQRLGAHVIFDSSEIPNEIFDLLVVHESVYKENFSELCQVSAAWFKTLQYMKDNPGDSAKRITQRLGVEVKDYEAMMGGIVLATMDVNRELLTGNEPKLIPVAKRLAEIMMREKQLAHMVNIQVAVDSSYETCITP